MNPINGLQSWHVGGDGHGRWGREGGRESPVPHSHWHGVAHNAARQPPVAPSFTRWEGGREAGCTGTTGDLICDAMTGIRRSSSSTSADHTQGGHARMQQPGPAETPSSSGKGGGGKGGGRLVMRFLCSSSSWLEGHGTKIIHGKWPVLSKVPTCKAHTPTPLVCAKSPHPLSFLPSALPFPSTPTTPTTPPTLRTRSKSKSKQLFIHTQHWATFPCAWCSMRAGMHGGPHLHYTCESLSVTAHRRWWGKTIRPFLVVVVPNGGKILFCGGSTYQSSYLAFFLSIYPRLCECGREGGGTKLEVPQSSTRKAYRIDRCLIHPVDWHLLRPRVLVWQLRRSW